MKTKRSFWFIGSLTFTGLILILCLGSTSRVHAQEESSEHGRLVGTWVVNVTPNPISICNGPQIADAPRPFTELVTYAAGGTLTETNSELNANSGGSALHLSGSDGHGAWRQDEGQVKTTFRKLLFDPTGAYVGNTDLNETLTVDRSNQLSGSFTITFSFVSGSASLCSSGTVSGTRMIP